MGAGVEDGGTLVRHRPVHWYSCRSYLAVREYPARYVPPAKYSVSTLAEVPIRLGNEFG